MSIDLSLTRLIQILNEKNCTHLYVKNLAPNDNNKNQPYFGPGFESINIIPTQGIYVDDSTHETTFKAKLDFYWLDNDGNHWQAPHTKLILYPQYPEVRFSGFLKGCNQKKRPSDLFKPREGGQSMLPKRLLFMGTTEDGKIYGYVVPSDSALGKEFQEAGIFAHIGVFQDASPLLLKGLVNIKEVLLERLLDVHQKDWIQSKRLRNDGTITDCKAPNCGGYTLEAELGIVPNGYSEPDFMGWEIKQHQVASFTSLEKQLQAGVITLMTPEPTAGYYKEQGVVEFVRKYGYKDKHGRPDRYNFGGIHKANVLQALTGLTLSLDGYDAAAEKITSTQGGIVLYDSTHAPAAVWRFADLMSHWNRKHAQAVYIPSIIMRADLKTYYKYGNLVRLGEGTDFLRFLSCVAQGTVYYDPGVKVEDMSTRPRTKRRSQFRIKSKEIEKLYNKLTLETLK